MNEMKLAAAVLAGGDGGRLGMPKFLLRLGSETFLQRILRSLNEAGVSDVRIALPARHLTMATDVPSGAHIVPISNPDGAMIISLRATLESPGSCDAAFVIPVDHPYVLAGTYRRLADEFRLHPASVIKPIYQETSGHPVIIPHEIIRRVLASSDEATLRDIIHTGSVSQRRVEVNDPGVIRNINTQNDLQRAGER